MTKLKVNESSEFWQSVKSAAYDVAFTDKPWQYTVAHSGCFWGMREWFRRLGAVGLVHALLHQHGVPAGVTPGKPDDGDTVRRATEARGRALEFE